jgi:hypothetical protein
VTEPENPEDLDIEAPEVDAAEQHADAAPDEPQDRLSRELPIDADPADVSEQEREVGFGEDEYR